MSSIVDSKRQNVKMLFRNLILEKRQLQLQEFINILLKPCKTLDLLALLTLMVVFILMLNKIVDQLQKKPSGGYYVKFACKFYITQEEELTFLKKLAALVQCKNKISKITNNKTKKLYNRLEVTHPTILIDYFSKY